MFKVIFHSNGCKHVKVLAIWPSSCVHVYRQQESYLHTLGTQFRVQGLAVGRAKGDRYINCHSSS